MSKARKVLTMQQRVDVIKDLETFSIACVAKRYGVHPKTIKRIQERAAEICNFAEKGKLEKRRKIIRQPKYEELEERLYVWFTERRAVGGTISDALLIRKACELNQQLEACSNFKFSYGWLAKFKRRRHIRLLKIYDEETSADEHGANLLSGTLEERAAEEEDQEEVAEEEEEERAAEEGDQEKVAEEEEERAAEEEDQEWAAEEDQERAAEEREEERATDKGDRVNGAKLPPKLIKICEDFFKHSESFKKYLTPAEQCHLEGFKLTMLGTSKERKVP